MNNLKQKIRDREFNCYASGSFPERCSVEGHAFSESLRTVQQPPSDQGAIPEIGTKVILAASRGVGRLTRQPVSNPATVLSILEQCGVDGHAPKKLRSRTGFNARSQRGPAAGIKPGHCSNSFPGGVHFIQSLLSGKGSVSIVRRGTT